MKTRYKAGKIVATLMVVSMLAACSSTGSNSSNGGSTASTNNASSTNTVTSEPQQQSEQHVPVTITIPDLPADDSGVNRSIMERQARFAEEHPWITVNHTPKSTAAVEQQMQEWLTTLLTNNSPSAIEVPAINYARDLYNAGFIEPWNDYLDSWADYNDIPDRIKEAFVVDGNTIGIPSGVEIPLLGFNRDLLEAANINADELVISSWDDYIAVTKQLTTEKQSGASLLLNEYFLWFNNWNVANGGEAAVQQDKKIELQFNNQATMETLSFFRDLVHEHKVVTHNLNYDLGGLLQEIWDGKVASFTYYPQWAQWWAGSGMPPEIVKLMAFPAGPSGEGSNPIFPRSWMINKAKSAEEKEATALYLQYVYGIDSWTERLEFAQENGIVLIEIPPYQSIDWASYADGIPADWVEATSQAMESGFVDPLSSSAYTNYFVTPLIKMISEPTIDLEAELLQAQEVASKEWLDQYNQGK